MVFCWINSFVSTSDIRFFRKLVLLYLGELRNYTYFLTLYKNFIWFNKIIRRFFTHFTFCILSTSYCSWLFHLWSKRSSLRRKTFILQIMRSSCLSLIPLLNIISFLPKISFMKIFNNIRESHLIFLQELLINRYFRYFIRIN